MSTKVAVVGLGVSGISAGQALVDEGYQVRGFASTVSTRAGEAPKQMGITVKEDSLELARAIIDWQPEWAVVSPGIPATSSLIGALKAANLPLVSEVELAWQMQENGPHAGRPWYCVTGTNGKTTTVELLSTILEAAGHKVGEVGNVGTPITSQVTSDADVFVVELSSFQLEYSRNMRPSAAICLNIDADHLDWHGSQDAYRRAKLRIYDNVDGPSFYLTGHPEVSNNLPKGVEAMAIDPQQADTTHGNWEWVPFFADRGLPAPLREDIAAAVSLARAAGANEQAIERGLLDFRPSAHRLALVAERDGVRYVDDSKATNAHAAAAALSALPEQSAIWIAGGDTKGQSFDSLVRDIRTRLKAVILIGADRSLLRRAIAENSPLTPIVEVMGDGNAGEWMKRAVEAAASFARPGDTVILSPACASWDQFVSYSQRGEVFSAAVEKMLGVK